MTINGVIGNFEHGAKVTAQGFKGSQDAKVVIFAPMRFLTILLMSGLVLTAACKSSKNKKKEALPNNSRELLERTDYITGHCYPEGGSGALLYFNLDSVYFLNGFLQSGYQVSILGTEKRYEEMQSDPYWSGAQLPLVYYNEKGIQSDEFFSTIFFDRVAEKMNTESIAPLLISAYQRLNDTGKLVVVLPKKSPQIAESHLKIIQNQVELRKWLVDTTFSANYQILTILK